MGNWLKWDGLIADFFKTGPGTGKIEPDAWAFVATYPSGDDLLILGDYVMPAPGSEPMFQGCGCCEKPLDHRITHYKPIYIGLPKGA